MACRNLGDGGNWECYPDMKHNARQCDSWSDFIMKKWGVAWVWWKLSQFQLQSQWDCFWKQRITNKNIDWDTVGL